MSIYLSGVVVVWVVLCALAAMGKHTDEPIVDIFFVSLLWPGLLAMAVIAICFLVPMVLLAFALDRISGTSRHMQKVGSLFPWNSGYM